MKRTILALALVATTFGAFAQTPTAAQKPAVHKSKSHKKTEEKKVVETAPKATTAPAPKADKKK